MLNSVEKMYYTLGSEKSLLSLVTEFIVNMWEARKQKLYGDDSCPNQLQSQSSPGGLRCAAGVEGQRDGKSRKVICIVFAMHVEYLLLHVTCVLMHVHVLVVGVIMCMDTCTCMYSSTHSCRCMADGGDAMAAFGVLLCVQPIFAEHTPFYNT